MSAVIRYDYLFIDANHKTFNQIIKLITIKEQMLHFFRNVTPQDNCLKGQQARSFVRKLSNKVIIPLKKPKLSVLPKLRDVRTNKKLR